MEKNKTGIREVWGHNLMEEMKLIRYFWKSHPYISIDTEFPGFLHHTPRHASEEERYSDMKKNVDSMEIIQLGLTLSKENGSLPYPGCSWQINFREFHPSSNVHNEASIALLKSSGIDFERNRKEGVDARVFSRIMLILLWQSRFSEKETKWVTFHGSYDIAYLLKLLTGAPLPGTLSGFMALAAAALGSVFDVKYMAQFCDGMRGGEVGLSGLGKLMKLEVDGQLHQAGYDSLLTSRLFSKMKWVFALKEDEHEGVLYGLESKKIQRNKRNTRVHWPYYPYFGSYPAARVPQFPNQFYYSAPASCASPWLGMKGGYAPRQLV